MCAPSKCLSQLANPVSGFIRNKNKMQSDYCTHQHNGARDQKRWTACVLLCTTDPGKVYMWRAPQLLKKSQQRCHKEIPVYMSGFFKCSLPGWWTNIGRKINFTRNHFRTFPLPFPSPKWKRDVQKQCLALNWFRAGKKTFAHQAYVLSLRRHLSQHLLLCLEGQRQRSPSTRGR